MPSAVRPLSALSARAERWAQRASRRALETGSALVVLALLAGTELAFRRFGPVGVVACVAAALAGAIAWTRLLVHPVREARREIAQSERRYRRLYEEIAAGVIAFTTDGRLTAANPAFRRMLGYAALEELRAVDFHEEIYGGPGTFAALLARARAEGEVANVEVRLRRRDGPIVTGLATLSAVWDDAGECVAFEGTVIDISDRKLAERQRRSTELRFRRLFESNAVGVMFGNLRRGTLDDANEALLAMLGLRRTELPVPLVPFTPEEFLGADRRAVQRLRLEGHVEPFEKEFLTRDGARVPVLISAAIVDAHEQDFIGVVIDRSAEVDAARRLAATKAFYEMLLDSVPTRIARVDLDERLVWCNRAYREWFGDPQLVGRTVLELVGPERYAAVSHQIARARAGETLRFASVIERDGVSYTMDTTYVPLRDAAGRVTGFLSFVHDVSAVCAPDARAGELRGREVA